MAESVNASTTTGTARNATIAATNSTILDRNEQFDWPLLVMIAVGLLLLTVSEFVMYRLLRRGHFFDLGPTEIHMEHAEEIARQEKTFATMCGASYHRPWLEKGEPEEEEEEGEEDVKEEEEDVANEAERRESEEERTGTERSESANVSQGDSAPLEDSTDKSEAKSLTVQGEHSGLASKEKSHNGSIQKSDSERKSTKKESEIDSATDRPKSGQH